MGFFAHAQTVDTGPLFPPTTWPGYEANLVLTVNRAYPATSVSKSESTVSGASAPDDKTATVQYKPATSLAGNNNALA